MALIDEVEIRVHAGAGGNGCISFRREKYVPRGGPDGGNGGDGGSVYLVATREKTSLLDFKYRPKYEADRGEHGKGKDMYGRGGTDLLIQVPLGTQVFEAETGDFLVDLIQDGQSFQVARGGRGGRGNITFTTSTNRAPRMATPGEAGEARELKLELKLLADVGLVGLPNAGKSSLLRAVSRAEPKVADYPFTTLQPHLGVVEAKDQVFVLADLPGLIEGAAQGVGLGHQFLKHVSRNRILLHLVDVSEDLETIEKNINIIEAELTAYDPELLARERWLVYTKCDLMPEEELEEKKKGLLPHGLKTFFISSKTGYGRESLLSALAEKASGWRPEEPPPVEADHETAPSPAEIQAGERP